jgi:hypothetical protein
MQADSSGQTESAGEPAVPEFVFFEKTFHFRALPQYASPVKFFTG